MAGRVEEYLLDRIRRDGAIHMVLVDPEVAGPEEAARVAAEAERRGTAAVMVGGSTVVLKEQLDSVVKAIKKSVKIPVILFPNNVTGISRYADAIWFMSLLNSTDPYFIVGAQVLGAPAVKAYGLEPIPMAYIIVGHGVTAGFIGKAMPLPRNKPELAAAYALAAQYLGMRFVYLEAGSGAPEPVSEDVVKAVRNTVDIPIIVGGGIRSGDQARRLVEAGANIIVTGTVVEEDIDAAGRKIGELVAAIQRS